MGVPAVTSNLAGFGTFAINLKKNIQKHGLYIVDRDQQRLWRISRSTGGSTI